MLSSSLRIKAPIRVQLTQSAFHRHAQCNASRRRDVRPQSTLFARWLVGSEDECLIFSQPRSLSEFDPRPLKLRHITRFEVSMRMHIRPDHNFGGLDLASFLRIVSTVCPEAFLSCRLTTEIASRTSGRVARDFNDSRNSIPSSTSVALTVALPLAADNF